MNQKRGAGTRLLQCLAGAVLACAGWMAAPPAAVFAEPQATQWYVSEGGNDASGCGTMVNPCGTISHVLLLPAFAAGDQINVTGAITDNFTLTENVVIAGAPGTSIDGDVARIVTVNAGVHATLSNLTLHNGGGDQDGGAIYNAGTLTVNNSTISNNSAHYGGGIENVGTIMIVGSTISNNSADSGGGIDNTGNGIVHLSRSIVMGNVAPSAAGIYNDFGLSSRMWLTETAVISNTASNEAGGILNGGQLSLVNVTLSNNRINSGFGAAIDHQSGSLFMQSVTVAGNTVANATDSSAANFVGSGTIRNSVIANSGLANCSGSITSAGYNLSSDTSCNYFDQSTDAKNVDARLGALQVSSLTYSTYTNPPLRDSPLVNRIPSASCGSANDQRGVSRPQDGACDIGAHEVMPVDLSLTASSTPASLPAGTPLTVTLNVANATGTAIATGVVITSDLPVGVVLKDCDLPATCVASGGRLTITVGVVNAGSNVVTSVRLTPQQSGNVAVAFNVAGNEWDRQLTNNSATINASVLKSADLSIRLNGALLVTAHATFTVTVDVVNNGELAADSPAFTITLPTTVNFIAAHGESWNCAPVAGAVSCTAQTSLLARGISQVVITLQSADAPAQLQFVGSATSSTFDPNITNNTSTMTVTVGSGSRVALPIVLR